MAIANVQIRGACGIQRFINSFNLLTLSTPSLHPYETAKQLVEQVRLNIATDLIDCLPEDAKLTHIKVILTEPGTGYSAWYRYPIDEGFGLRTGSFSNNAVNPTFLGFTDQAQRVAKFFIGAVSDDDIEGNLLVAGLITEIEELAASLITGVETETPAILWKWGIPTSPAGAEAFVEGASIAGVIGTQRRRRQFV